MKKSVAIPGAIGLFLLVVALVFRWLDLPNQIPIIIAGAVSLFLISHILYLPVRFSRQNTLRNKFFEVALFMGMIFLLVSSFLYFYRSLRITLMILWGILMAGILLIYLLPILQGKSSSNKTHVGFASMYIIGLVLIWLTNPVSFQIPDKFYKPEIADPAYPEGEGPVVMVDEAHHNFHTISGRYYAFANVLRSDGYQVLPLSDEVSPESLEDCQILVIANALHEENEERWINPVLPAFTEAETNALVNWVASGGSLFLIADHMPMAGAVSDIGKRFGFIMHNGFNFDQSRGPDLFCIADSTLVAGPLLTTEKGEYIDSILTFTGHGFDFPEDARPVLRFNKGSYILLPDTAWCFNASTTRLDAEGMAQIAYKKYGEGRVVVSGEAAMFTSQFFGGFSWKRGGMGSPNAGNNHKLLLNILHWLDGSPLSSGS